MNKRKLSEAIKAGQARARAQGCPPGRRSVNVDLGALIELRGRGLGVRKIAALLGLKKSTVATLLAAIPPAPAPDRS